MCGRYRLSEKADCEEYFASVSGRKNGLPLQLGRVQGGSVIPVQSRNGGELVNRTDRLDRIPA
jgi:hypothetical protein